jgi:hypothetical protein
MAAMRRKLLLGAALAVSFFALGALSSRWLASPAAAPPQPAPSSSPTSYADADAGAKEPVIVLDTDAINLLPDASLRLTLPPGFDGGP